jgi:hypothetical protein
LTGNVVSIESELLKTGYSGFIHFKEEQYGLRFTDFSGKWVAIICFR